MPPVASAYVSVSVPSPPSIVSLPARRLNDIGPAVALQGVVAAGTDQILKVVQRIGCPVTVIAGRAAYQAHRNAGGGVGVGYCVRPRTPIDDVRTAAAGDDVVAVAARQYVPIAIPGESIVVTGAGQILEVGDSICACAARVLCGGDCQADRDFLRSRPHRSRYPVPAPPSMVSLPARP